MLYANVDDVFIIFNEKKEPEYVSDNSLRILGFDPDAITNNKEELLNRFYDEDRNWLRNILNDRTIIKTATRNIELKGSSQTFQLSVYPVRQGLIDWTVVSLFDETEELFVLAEPQAAIDKTIDPIMNVVKIFFFINSLPHYNIKFICLSPLSHTHSATHLSIYHAFSVQIFSHNRCLLCYSYFSYGI